MHFTRSLLLTTALLPALALAHGHLSVPPPRGIEKLSYNRDALNSPNFGGQICRGEPEGQITQVAAGGSLTLEFDITAPHIGPCIVYVLDLDLNESSQQKIAEKRDCVAPGKVEPWTVTIPAGLSGRKVLRWYWEGQHIGIPGEPYEQCVDLMIGSGSQDGGSYAGAPKQRKQRPQRVEAYGRRRSSRPKPRPAQAAEPQYEAEAPVTEPDYYEAEDTEAESGSYEEDAEAESGSYGAEDAEAESTGNEEETYAEADADDQSGDAAAYGNEEHSGEAEQYAAPQQTEYEAESSDAEQGKGCKHGKYVCNKDGTFSICSNNVWIKQACGTGQKCAPSNGSILCVLASHSNGY